MFRSNDKKDDKTHNDKKHDDVKRDADVKHHDKQEKPETVFDVLKGAREHVSQHNAAEKRGDKEAAAKHRKLGVDHLSKHLKDVSFEDRVRMTQYGHAIIAYASGSDHNDVKAHALSHHLFDGMKGIAKTTKK